MRWRIGMILAAALATAACPIARSERIKDIVDLKGATSNPLTGMGVVTGLQGTGDGSTLTKRLLANYLRRQGAIVTPAEVDTQNAATVIINAELGPFAMADSKLDVTVSTIAGATSLLGGELQITGLKGADGEDYAVAQGSIVIGGFAASGKAGSVTKNHTTTGRIPGGATVIREELAKLVENNEITLLLRNADFTTAQNIADAVNEIHPNSSTAISPAAIRIRMPATVRKANLAKFISQIGELQVKVDQPAVVVINERTGTIIVGEKVGISTVGISHGNLFIIKEETEAVSQPLPFSQTGTTEKTQLTSIRVSEEKHQLSVVPKQISVSELARALNAMGLTPRDLISIFTALRKSGALQAELKIM